MRFNIHRSPKLLIGAIALVLCCCTLVGGTLAWLAEGPIAISDGEVDAKLYWSSDLTDWQDAENGSPIFGAAQWEPGHTQIRYLKVSNAAELDFSYILSLDSKNPAGPLAQAIDVYCCEAPGAAFTSFSQLRAQADFSGTLQTVLDSGLTEGTLESGDAVYAVALHMRESAGNTFQGQTLENISLTLDAELFTNGVTMDVPLVPGVLDILPESAIAASTGVNFSGAPYAYTDTSLFAGKTITKIGIPVKSVEDLDNAFFTLSVVRTDRDQYEYVSQHRLSLNLDQGISTLSVVSPVTVNKWIYVDVNITLAKNETLAFGHPDDTVNWGYLSASNAAYRFRSNISGYQSWNTPHSESIYFDVYTEKTLTNEEYLEQLRQEQAQLEQEQKLKEALSGKRLSILGDSISTFRGWSNNTSYNSTIGGNAVWYNGSNGVTDVNETWWMQTINRTGMELLVNNSWSGDTVTSTAKNQGISRSLQLHNNSGTTPDLIAVYFGINDFRYEVSVTDFAAKYDEMVKGMKEKYQNADIFLFTLVYTTSSVSKPYDVEYFNDAITATAAKYGCALVDLYGSSGINADTMAANMHDGNLHPNYDGMDKITDCFMEVLMKKYVHAES